MHTLSAYLTLLTLGLLAQGAAAHLPEIYGRDYVRIEPDNFAYQPPDNTPRLITPPDPDVKRHELAVERAGANGPYHPGLTDPLQNLAEFHAEQGNTDEAIAIYRRALHLVRISDGLDSERQVPVLQRLLALYRSQPDHAALGDLYEYYYHALKLDQPPFAPDKTAAVLEYVAWEHELAASRPHGAAREHILRAYHAGRAHLEALHSATPAGPAHNLETYLASTRSHLRSLYLVLGEDALSGTTPSESIAESSANRELGALQTLVLGQGRKLLRTALARAESAPAVTRAQLILEQGDWEQWNGFPRGAKRYYAEVVRLLTEHDEIATLTQWLGEPQELPDEAQLWPLIQEIHEREPVVVEARYEVSRTGDARALAVSVDNESDTWQASRIRRMLVNTHFRPQVGPDGPEHSETLTRHYRLIAID